MTIQLIPSILSADFGHLVDEVQAAHATGIRKVQVDVMDGQFVPNISVGLPVVKALAKHVPDLVLDVHLMIVQPERYLQAFADAGARVLTVHTEATVHLHRAVEAVKAMGIEAGAAVNPATPLVALEEILPELDVALVMTVNPGFGGQAFIQAMVPKIKRLAAMIAAAGAHAAIQVDGGISPATAGAVIRAGATQLVAGSSVFGAGVPIAEAVARLKAAAAGETS